MKLDRIAVLIPCYNESKTIEKVVRDFKKELPEAVVYVFDNNSDDGADAIAKEAGAVVFYEKKQGKGNVVRTMFRRINAECYLMIDGDDTYSASGARVLCDLVLEENADMVIGDRLSSTYFTENKRLFHNAGNKLVKTLINMIFKSNVNDIMTGYRAFSYAFVKSFPSLSKGFEIETEMTIHSLDNNLNIINAAIEYKDRIPGSESKLNTYTDGYRILKTIFGLYKNYRPYAFFSVLSILLLFVSAAFLAPVLFDYFQTGLVPRFPSFIASSFFASAALQSFFAGLILDMIANKNRRDFEAKYIERSTQLQMLKSISE